MIVPTVLVRLAAVGRKLVAVLVPPTRNARIRIWCVALCCLTLGLPSPYVVEMPGPTQDVLGAMNGKAVIHVAHDAAGAQPESIANGQLRLVTVNVAGVPGYPVSNLFTMSAWLDPESHVLPQEVFFPTGQTPQQYEIQSKRQMDSSQAHAIDAAKQLVAARWGKQYAQAEVKLHVEDIGGPSAGLMYALGIIAKLSPERLVQAHEVIAGTGTIDEHGAVGPIGGIQLKMLGARRDGATWFFAPASNCDEVVGHVPQGLRDVRVSTLQEALDAVQAIGRGEGARLPHCAA